MSGAGLTIVRRVQTLLGGDAIVDTRADGLPRVAPRTAEACALVLQTAAAEGWKVRMEGSGRWAPSAPGADLALSTRGLSRVVSISAPDLVATAEGGILWEELRRALADHGAWLALDPPGTGRTLGSVAATGTAGPLRTGYGGVRDHILGLTLVTGDGRIVRAGGRVVKNVAGFDLTKLATGSFGAFGVITSLHLRLRSVPRADATLVREGERDDLLQRGAAVIEAGEVPAALELLSPAAGGRSGWTLAIRLLGSEAAVAHARHAVAAACGGPMAEVPQEASASFWHSVAAGATAGPLTLRLGSLPGSLTDTLDLVTHQLSDEWIAVSIGAAAVRWAGAASLERVKRFRSACAQHEFPVTLERAPWEVLEGAGHFGAYREGVARLVSGMRRVFDPQGVLALPAGDG